MRPICNTRRPPSIAWPLLPEPGNRWTVIAKLDSGVTGCSQNGVSHSGGSLAEPCRQAGPVFANVQ
jgi:hypothetical protein